MCSGVVKVISAFTVHHLGVTLLGLQYKMTKSIANKDEFSTKSLSYFHR